MKKSLMIVALTSVMLLTSCSGEKFTEVAEENKTATVQEAKQKINDCEYGNGVNISSNITSSIVTDGNEVKTNRSAESGMFRDSDQYVQTYTSINIDNSYAKVYFITSAEGVFNYFDINYTSDSLTGNMKVYMKTTDNPASYKISDESWKSRVGSSIISAAGASEFFEESSKITTTVSTGDKGSVKIETSYSESMTTGTTTVPCTVTGDITIDSTGHISGINGKLSGSVEKVTMEMTNSVSFDYNFSMGKMSNDGYKSATELTTSERTTFLLLLAALGLN